MNHEGKRMGRLVVKRCLIIGTVLTILAATLFSLRVSRAYQESPRLPQLTKAEREWLSLHPVIRLAPDPEFRPIEFFDSQGNYDGVAADHIRLLEQKLGIRFTIVRLANWDQVMEQFQKHEVDLIGAIAPTPRRQQMMRFTAPLLTVPGGIFVRAGSTQTLTLADLKGMRVAVVSNYMAHDYLKNEHPDILLDVVPDTATGLNRVSLGVDDAYVENLATAVYYLQRQGISNLRLAGQTDFTYSWAMGVRSDWPELQGILDKGLSAIGEDERRQILNRWIYVAEIGWRPTHLQISLAVGALLAALLIATLIWSLSLKRLVQQRTAELERSVREMESFCHSVSHDLRAPLRHINAYSAIVSEEFASKLSEEGQGYLQRIALASRRMGELIDDLLGLSRLSRAELQCVEVDLSQLCREIATELAEREPMRQVRFIVASGIRGTGDPQLLRLLLYNLLDNAWKYTAQTAEPQIEVGVEQQQGETVYLVKDNGAGFDMAHAEKLFTPFQRLHREDEFSGIGIGLATVQRIVERHGGRVWGEGYPQGGATFRFTLGMKGERNVVIGG